MNTRETDQRAWEAHQSGKTWAQVARELLYANGSVARRAALRHAERIGPMPDESPLVVRPPVFLVDTERGGEPMMRIMPDVDIALDVPIYHRGLPKAKFKFVKWNTDGSLQLYGGEGGYAAYRDYHAEFLSNVPSDGFEAIYVWASHASRLHQRYEVPVIAAAVNAPEALVRKAVRDRPDVFRRIQRGVYEIRDPKADRSADKAKAS